MTALKFDVHKAITDTIITQIEQGAGDFTMPWHRATPIDRPRNVASKKAYRGINILSLWVACETRGFSANTWGTYKQWQEIGAQVRKGEKGSMIVIYKEYETRPDPNDPNDDGRRLLARASTVFNAAQVDGYDATETAAPDLGPIERIARADAFVKATNATIRHGGQRAFYRPSDDFVQMPDEGLFLGDQGRRTDNYYATLLHELTHWTGAKHRLNRGFGSKFGNAQYALEELVAELGAAFLCSTLQITNSPRIDHAQYIANWLEALKNDPKAIFKAASKASAAADYLENLATGQQQQAAA